MICAGRLRPAPRRQTDASFIMQHAAQKSPSGSMTTMPRKAKYIKQCPKRRVLRLCLMLRKAMHRIQTI